MSLVNRHNLHQRPVTTRRVDLVSGALTPAALAAKMQSANNALPKANSAIDQLLKSKILPHYPNLLVPTGGTPLLTTSRAAWEHEALPFEPFEIGRGIQYVTLVNSPPNRGVTFAEGGWEELDDSTTSTNNIRSPTGTPDPNKPRTKISLKDYKSAPKKSAEEAEKTRELQLARKKAEIEKQGSTGQGEVQVNSLGHQDKRTQRKETEKTEERKRMATGEGNDRDK